MTYKVRKDKGCDAYGVWDNGKQITPERIANRTLTYDARREPKWKAY